MGVRSPSTVTLPPTRRTHSATERSLAPAIAGRMIIAAMRSFVRSIVSIIARMDFWWSIAIVSLSRKEISSITVFSARVMAWVPWVLWKSLEVFLLNLKGLRLGSQVRFGIFHFHSGYFRLLAHGE